MNDPKQPFQPQVAPMPPELLGDALPDVAPAACQAYSSNSGDPCTHPAIGVVIPSPNNGTPLPRLACAEHNEDDFWIDWQFSLAIPVETMAPDLLQKYVEAEQRARAIFTERIQEIERQCLSAQIRLGRAQTVLGARRAEAGAA